ncbi:lipoprotein N-acyltransferase Lnb domain-containing protein [Flavobacterium sp. XGLA_31]|uniref:lipoprotein N-acyltransferase Lnb domain-containing protein n=1 Tax=Flavobacterium sp. XGLA_31 TaxID=3447666 RepID=UPI003F3B1635
MFKNKIFLLFLWVLLLSNSLIFGQMSLGKNAEVSILTCGEGNELYSLFGHTAIRIKDDINALDVVYNYGTFDFSTENFYLKFVKGDLRYFVTATTYNDFFNEYVLENRSIYEQKINLTDLQKQQLFERLNHSLESEEKYYTYKFIDRNCTNMVVDKVNQTLGQNCIVKTTEKDLSYRQILYPYLRNHFIENLGIMIIFGKKVDDNGEKLFLPNQFMESLKTTKLYGKPVSEAPKLILKAEAQSQTTSLWNNFYAFTLVFLLIVLTRKTWIYLTLFAIFGLLGTFLSLVGWYSYHAEVAWNYNTLLFNPLLLALIYCYWQQNFVWVKRFTQIGIVMLMALVVILLDKPNLVMFLPMILSMLLMLFYFLRKSNRALLPTVK